MVQTFQSCKASWLMLMAWTPRYFVLRCLALTVFISSFVYICKMGMDVKICDVRSVDPDHVKRVQMFAKEVLQAQCRPDFAETRMEQLFRDKYNRNLTGFMKKNQDYNDSSYEYGPPFGFRSYIKELGDILKMMPEDDLPSKLNQKSCKRCIVMGSGGILHGLDLGHVVDQFDIVIRLNNAPVHNYERDVGEKTTIRMTYPEGAPVSEQEYLHGGLFVTVLFKRVDFKWLQAVLDSKLLSAWNRLFFWKRVAEKLPLNPNQIRILNPLIIKETAIDLLEYPKPRKKWFGWDKNLPTIGVTGVVLATHLCDEVSLAGFGYDLRQPDTSLHYYDTLCMNEMNQQTMHDVSKEKEFLRTLVKEGIVQDLSGGIHCAFCDKRQLDI
ncbi:lactosylceramide alpha-2,3-sialyltransferase [Rhinophrynus dorsalis]